MKMTSSNTRMCVVTRKKKQKEELIQITKINDIWVLNDKPYKGRSLYISKDLKAVEKFVKKPKKIRRFEMTDELKEELIEYAKNL